jgi:hypothetical protein
MPDTIFTPRSRAIVPGMRRLDGGAFFTSKFWINSFVYKLHRICDVARPARSIQMAANRRDWLNTMTNRRFWLHCRVMGITLSGSALILCRILWPRVARITGPGLPVEETAIMGEASLMPNRGLRCQAHRYSMKGY